MKKKFLATLLTVSMAATMLVGCGSGDDAKESDTQKETPKEDADDSKGDELITIGFAQVGHESDWRTASTKSCQDVFSKENGYDLQFVDCDNDSAVQLEAVRNFIEQDVDYIIIDPIVANGWVLYLPSARMQVFRLL